MLISRLIFLKNLCGLEVSQIIPCQDHAEDIPRSAVDCFSLEVHRLDILGKDQIVRPQGKDSRLNFETPRLRTCHKLGSGFYLALGRAGPWGEF